MEFGSKSSRAQMASSLMARTATGQTMLTVSRRTWQTRLPIWSINHVQLAFIRSAAPLTSFTSVRRASNTTSNHVQRDCCSMNAMASVTGRVTLKFCLKRRPHPVSMDYMAAGIRRIGSTIATITANTGIGVQPGWRLIVTRRSVTGPTMLNCTPTCLSMASQAKHWRMLRKSKPFFRASGIAPVSPIDQLDIGVIGGHGVRRHCVISINARNNAFAKRRETDEAMKTKNAPTASLSKTTLTPSVAMV